MELFNILYVFVLGTIVGSFLNVVIYRYNSGTSPLKGRSQCFACGKTLRWYELIPLASFLVQRARCRGCSVRLSWQYPLVEVISGLLFVAVFALDKPLLESIYLIAIFSILLVIAVYDMRHQIIPDGLVALLSILSLLWFVWTLPFGISQAVHFPYYLTLLAGPLLFLPFWVLWFFSRGRWMGLGDGKLALFIGWFLGLSLGMSAIMIGFWVGALFSGVVIAVQRIQKVCNVSHRASLWSLKSEIPFGPFLILGVVVVYFTHINFFDGSVDIFKLLF
jgi:leader peptidase (prepilin peptidase) / N-methyltransferase